MSGTENSPPTPSGGTDGRHVSGEVSSSLDGGPVEGQGPHSEGPALPRAGFKVGTEVGQERGGPSGLTLSCHGGGGLQGHPQRT